LKNKKRIVSNDKTIQHSMKASLIETKTRRSILATRAIHIK